MNTVQIQISEDATYELNSKEQMQVCEDEIPLSFVSQNKQYKTALLEHKKADVTTLVSSICRYATLYAMDIERLDSQEIHVLLCSQKEMKELNKQFRNKDECTDVLSFAYQTDSFVQNESVDKNFFTVLGDISICPMYVVQQAKECSEHVSVELARISIHGVLHLCGYEHKTYNNAEPMLIKQEKILQEFINKNKIEEKI